MFEYQVLTWQEHRAKLLLAKLNELGAEGWRVAGTVGNTIILCRAIGNEKFDGAMSVYITGDKNE